MRRKCTIWWPKNLTSSEPSSSHFLFGWFISCSSASIDIGVVFACNDVSLSHSRSGLQEILHCTNVSMPVFLHDKTMFSLLGQGKMLKVGMEEGNWKKSCSSVIASATVMQDIFKDNYGGRSCECYQLDGLVKQNCDAFAEGDHWIQLVYDCHQQYSGDICWLPKLHHIHWNGAIIFQFDVHVCNSL